MVLPRQCERSHRILSEDSGTHTAVAIVLELLEQIGGVESGYQEGVTVRGSERGKDRVQLAAHPIGKKLTVDIPPQTGPPKTFPVGPDRVIHAAVGTVREKIRQALEKILQAELGSAEGVTLSGAERKKDYVQPAVYTIDGFCSAHLVSKAHFYALLRKGEGPKTFTAGKRRYVHREAAAEWVHRNEALAAAQSTRGAKP
jgi:hypothetical protein